MTPRQARRERRAAERKTKKLELKRNRELGKSGYPGDAPLFTSHVESREEMPPALSAAIASELDPGAISARTRINRQNAQHSTGPRSSQGKLASSRNSLKHGLTSGQTIIPGEDPAAFETLLHGLLEEHQPANPTEDLLAKEMAQAYWLMQRAMRLQNECFTADGVDEKRLSLFLRYYTTYERVFHKALNTLTKLKKERTCGFVRQIDANLMKTTQTRPGFVPQPPTPFGSGSFGKKPSEPQRVGSFQ